MEPKCLYHVPQVTPTSMRLHYYSQRRGLSPWMEGIIDEVAADLRLSLKNSAAKMTGTPLTVKPGEDEMSRKTLVRTLLRLARLLEPGSDHDKHQGVAG